MLGAALVAMQSAAITVKAQAEWAREFNRQFRGFALLEPLEFWGLVRSQAELPIDLRLVAGSDNEVKTFTFSLAEETTVYLTASAASAEVTFVHPLIVRLGSGRRHLLSLIRSETPGRRVPNSINLGTFTAGDHQITVNQDAAVAIPIPDSLTLTAARPASDSLLASFIDHNPVVKIKNLHNVLDDIPLVGYCHIKKRDSTAEYLVSSHLIFSSENGGSMPTRLMTSFQRTLDVEWVMEQIFRPDGRVVATQRRFQSRNHGIEPFEGTEMIGNSPVLTTATPNNLFGDDRVHIGRWSAPNPFRGEDDPIYYSPKPIFLPPGKWSQQVLDDMPELQQWSWNELAMEGCVDLSDRSNPRVQAFIEELQLIRESLRVPYPNRGCQSHKLSLP